MVCLNFIKTGHKKACLSLVCWPAEVKDKGINTGSICSQNINNWLNGLWTVKFQKEIMIFFRISSCTEFDVYQWVFGRTSGSVSFIPL